MYRINYGNGQVSNSFTSLAAARREMASIVAFDSTYSGFYRIQKRVEGEWVAVKEKKR